MVIAWTADLNTGIDVIDNQHKRIVNYINQLEDTVTQCNQRSIGAILDELMDYTLSHFTFEESLQEEAGYKFAKPHKAVHEMFAKRVSTYHQRHKAGEDVGAQLYGMLGTWLVHHIKRDDMAYVAEVGKTANNIIQDKKEGNWLSRSLGRFFK
jgi:hemerythrin